MSAAAVSAPVEKSVNKEGANKDVAPKDSVQKDAAQRETAQKSTVQSEDARWLPVMGLPCQLAVELPLPNFKVSDFLALQVGSVVATSWIATRDVPLRINGTLIGWGEMEGTGKSLAIRVTELA
jgi:flagellar motor switch/type III secretory pathway protein FliN